MLAPRPSRVLLSIMAVALLAPPAAGARSFFITARGSETGLGTVRTIGDFKPVRDPTLGAAIKAYGTPTSKRGGGEVCRVRWAGLGVRIKFQNFGAVNSCNPDEGLAQKAVVRGSRPWQTKAGLELGDTVRRLKRLHPDAIRTGRGFRLVQGILPFGSPQPYSVLGARVSGGTVGAFTLFIGAAGD